MKGTGTCPEGAGSGSRGPASRARGDARRETADRGDGGRFGVVIMLQWCY
jgi:hypothetical protein